MSMPGQTVTDTNNGFIVGADPKTTPPTGTEWAPVGNSTQPPAPVAPTPQPQGQQQQTFTAEDLERVRREEKDKLYQRIGQTEAELQQLKAEREAEAKRLRDEADARAAELRKKEEAEMEVRDLLIKKEQEWNNQIAEMNARYEADRAVFEKERALREIEDYKNARMLQESEYIAPQFRDFVRGDTMEEVDASIEEMKARTQSIFDEIAAANGQQRQQMRGAAPTAPPVGPMEQLPTQQQLSPEDIRNMSMDEYKKHRDGLLRGASQARQRGGY